jgi:hypothetical protein
MKLTAKMKVKLQIAFLVPGMILLSSLPKHGSKIGMGINITQIISRIQLVQPNAEILIHRVAKMQNS